jgi:hypothetical protein
MATSASNRLAQGRHNLAYVRYPESAIASWWCKEPSNGDHQERIVAQLEWMCGIACGVGWLPSAEWDDRCLPAYVVPAGQISRYKLSALKGAANATRGFGPVNQAAAP